MTPPGQNRRSRLMTLKSARTGILSQRMQRRHSQRNVRQGMAEKCFVFIPLTIIPLTISERCNILMKMIRHLLISAAFILLAGCAELGDDFRGLPNHFQQRSLILLRSAPTGFTI